MAEAVNNKDFLSEGGLESHPLARVFFELCLAQKTGSLDILTEPPPQGKILKRVYLVRGASFYVQGGALEETLGKVLIRQGKLTEEEHEKLLAEAGKDYGQLETHLVQGNRFPPQELLAALAGQTEFKIKRCFAWSRGYYRFIEMTDTAIQSKHVVHALSPEKLLFEGVQEYYPLPRIQKEFAGIEKKVFHRSARLLEWAPKLGLAPALRRFVLKIPEEFSFGPTAKGVDAKPQVSHPFLLALYLGGMITLPPEEEDFPLGRQAAPAKAKEKPEPEKKPDPAKAPPPKLEEPKLPIEKMLERDLSDQEILAELERMKQSFHKSDVTFFEILGVEQKTPPDKVKQVYFRMAKLYHPDAKPALYKGKVKELVEEVFTHLSEAYSVLSDREQKENYIRSLKSQVSTQQLDEAHRALEAETEFQKAEVLLRRANWAQAETLLRRAVELTPTEPEYRLYHAWAEFKVKGRGQAGPAKKVIEEALKSRPKAIEGHYFLGEIHKSEGQSEEAEACFRKVLELDPNHVEAQRELRLSTMRKEKSPDKKGGLFGRKK